MYRLDADKLRRNFEFLEDTENYLQKAHLLMFMLLLDDNNESPKCDNLIINDFGSIEKSTSFNFDFVSKFAQSGPIRTVFSIISLFLDVTILEKLRVHQNM
ncbi:hypothetical protein RF11_16473 [Thelohanellus kitauei]|uniref:Uncharacterized protein n=1 Tax=Thelohanellus kitauei TaxID=669202 RepID=A0A0C2NI29_THEKT|nr:hypothetical protein RF11_16473 [Thelohanellus kitauei]